MINRFKNKYCIEKEAENNLLREKRSDLQHKEYEVRQREMKLKEQDEAYTKLKEDYLKLNDNYEKVVKQVKREEERIKDRQVEFTILVNAAKRDQEALKDLEVENKLLRERLNTLEKGYNEQKVQMEERKNEYKETVDKLKEQLEEYKKDLTHLRDDYSHAAKERNNAATFKFDQMKSEYENLITKKDERIRSLEQDLESEKVLSGAGPFKLRGTSFLGMENIEDLKEPPADNSILHDPEYIAQKNKWQKLEDETELLRNDIETTFKPRKVKKLSASSSRKESPKSIKEQKTSKDSPKVIEQKVKVKELISLHTEEKDIVNEVKNYEEYSEDYEDATIKDSPESPITEVKKEPEVTPEGTSIISRIEENARSFVIEPISKKEEVAMKEEKKELKIKSLETWNKAKLSKEIEVNKEMEDSKEISIEEEVPEASIASYSEVTKYNALNKKESSQQSQEDINKDILDVIYLIIHSY